jgi:transcriptional regulator with XRE-family HTH domain
VLGTLTFYDQRMKTTLGRLVRDARAELKLTQEEAAERMGVERNWLAQIETDRVSLPSPEKLAVLERYLGLSREAMLRAAGYLGPAMGDDIVTVFRRVALTADLEDKIRLIESLPVEVQAALEVFAAQLVRERLRGGDR